MLTNAELTELRNAHLSRRAEVVPDIWTPKKGERIEGRFDSVRATPESSNSYQVIIATDKGKIAVWLLQTVWQQLVAQKAEKGDLIAIEFLGAVPDSRGYRKKSYFVTVLKAGEG